MKFILCSFLALFSFQSVLAETWHSDNGNGTFSNPLFYDEFSDPDMIRVGEDFYLTGTTMHTFPGLPVMHSKDLVNWDLLGYASEGLDFGPEYRLEGGRSVYGQGFWAPCIRHHNGTFYIFSNVNHRSTQIYTAKNPAGPWTHREMKRSFHDLSVLFDDDGKVYVVWGYRELHLAQLNEQLDDVVPGTERVLFDKNSLMGEGSHFYKINGKYYITSSWFSGRMRMPCARADNPEGPYEVNPAISADEEFGMAEGNRLANERGAGFELRSATKAVGRLSLHQGGLVQTPKGQWWGFAMMDYNSVGRLLGLSPVTWQEGWPYFGLPGNLGRTPRTWLKPDTGHDSSPSVPYQRNDSFDGPKLANVWQWNHLPVPDKCSLAERPGFLRLHSLPASDFWSARNTLTQRAVGPQSAALAELDPAGLKQGDIAGLALLISPYAWIGITRGVEGFEIQQFDQATGRTTHVPFKGSRVWLKVSCDFLSEKATFAYSTDGKTFRPLGEEFTMVYSGRTFQGVRYSLFNFNTGNEPGGNADFDSFSLEELHPAGITHPIPYGETIVLRNMDDGAVIVSRGDGLGAVASGDPLAGFTAAQFRVLDRKHGRIALQSLAEGRLVTVTGLGDKSRVLLEPDHGDDTQSFQWTEMPRGDLMLLSLASHRHLRTDPGQGTVTADAIGAQADRKNGASFTWRTVSIADQKGSN